MNEYIEARLYSAGDRIVNDKGKPIKWYAYYKVRDPDTGKMEQKKRMQGINKIKDKRQRKAFGKRLVKNINKLLAEGKLNHFKNRGHKLTLIEHLHKQHELFTARTKGDNPTLKLKSLHAYKWSMMGFIKWLTKSGLEFIRPEQFTRKHAYQFWDELVKGESRSAYTFNIFRNNVSRYFSAFVRRDIIQSNPFTGIEALKQTPARHIPFTDEQMEQIDGLLKEPHFEFWVFTRFIYYLYLRPEEIVKLQIEDINLQLHAVIVYGDKSKTKSQKAPYIPDALYKILSGMKLKEHPQKWYLFSRGLKPGPTPITRDYITLLFKQRVKKPLGMSEEYTMYAFKHTGIINAHAQGKSIKGIQLQAGHKTEKQTRGYMIKQGLIPNDEFKDMK